MNKRITLVAVVIGIALLVVLVVALSRNRADYEDYESVKEFVWKPSGLDLEKVAVTNTDILTEYGIDITIMREDEFYYDGSNWSAVVLSNDNIPYNIVIDSNFVATLMPVETDAEEVIE